MKTIEFDYYVTFGRGDSSEDIPCSVDLTDEEYQRVEKYLRKNPDEDPLDEKEFEDIYDKFIDAAVECEMGNAFDFEDVYDYLESEREDFDRDEYKVNSEDMKDYLTGYLSLGIIPHWQE